VFSNPYVHARDGRAKDTYFGIIRVRHDEVVDHIFLLSSGNIFARKICDGIGVPYARGVLLM